MSLINKLKPEKLFIIIATVVVGVFLIVMPLGEVPDERVHAKMSWEYFYYEPTSDGVTRWEYSIPKDNLETYFKFFTTKVDFSNDQFKPKLKAEIFSHLPQLVGMKLGQLIYPSMGIMMIIGRLFNALTYILGIYWIIKYMKYGKWTLTFIALLPMMAQQAGSLSYDVMNFLAVSLFFAFLTHFWEVRKLTLKNIIYLIGITFLLYVTKKNNLLLLPLIFVSGVELPIFLFKNKFFMHIWNFILKYRWLLIFSILILSLLLIGITIQRIIGIRLFFDIIINTLILNNRNPDLNSSLTVGIFGFFGPFIIPLPLWLIFVNIAVLTLLFVRKENGTVTKFSGGLAALMFPLQVITIVFVMYFAYTVPQAGFIDYSVGGQGRYFTPFLIFILLWFKSLQNKLSINLSERICLYLVSGTVIINYIITIYLISWMYWIK